MAQSLKMHTALAEDLVLIPSIRSGVSQLPATPVLLDMTCMGILGNALMYTNPQTDAYT